jgi:hypothetical protein
VKKVLLSAAAVFLFAAQSNALFSNGGFESGEAGWAITGDHSIVSSFTPQFDANAAWTPITSAFYGNSMLCLGSQDVGNVLNDNAHQSNAVSTDGIITQTDIDNGLHLYFKWAAVLEEPTNGVFHADNEQAYFSVNLQTFDVSSNLWSSVYSADHRANQPGFTLVGDNHNGDAGNIYLGSDIADIDLSNVGLVANDQVRLTLHVADCALGGHGGLVLLDGFGTIDPHNVPEPGLISLIGMGLLGLVGLKLRRR